MGDFFIVSFVVSIVGFFPPLCSFVRGGDLDLLMVWIINEDNFLSLRLREGVLVGNMSDYWTFFLLLT